MKLQNFFDNFDLLADTPDAVAKIRELVLELAVRGRLVEQQEGEFSLTEAQGHREKDEL